MPQVEEGSDAQNTCDFLVSLTRGDRNRIYITVLNVMATLIADVPDEDRPKTVEHTIKTLPELVDIHVRMKKENPDVQRVWGRA